RRRHAARRHAPVLPIVAAPDREHGTRGAAAPGASSVSPGARAARLQHRRAQLHGVCERPASQETDRRRRKVGGLSQTQPRLNARSAPFGSTVRYSGTLLSTRARAEGGGFYVAPRSPSSDRRGGRGTTNETDQLSGTVCFPYGRSREAASR